MTRWLYLSAALAVLTVGGTLFAYYHWYDELPERVPVHWNIYNEPDGWSTRDGVLQYLLILPLVSIAFIGLTVALPYLSPKPFGIDKFKDTYGYVMALVQVLFAFIQIGIVMGSFGQQAPMGQMVMAGVFLFFGLIGNVMGQVRRNYWMGVRTPWTLANDAVWIQTHRVAAWLWVVVGWLCCLLVIVVPLLLPRSLEAVLLGCTALLLLSAFYPVLYSWQLYRKLEREGKLQEPA